MKKGKLNTIFVIIIFVLLVIIGILLKVIYDENHTEEVSRDTKQRVEEKFSKDNKRKFKKEERKLEVVYSPKDYHGVPSDEELDAVRVIIETRLNAKNITDGEVIINRKKGKILVRFPWKSDKTGVSPQKVISELGETAKLTFQDSEGNVLLEGTDVEKAEGQFDQSIGGYVVALQLSDEGAVKFETATGSLIGQQMPIYMDETLISAPYVQTQISGGQAIITGMKNAEEAKYLADKINSGALPFALEVNNYSVR